MQMHQDIGPIHFIGIGGIGMSGIAEVLANQGYQVQGSDIAESPNVARLRDMGIVVAIGHDPANLDQAAVVVVSSAVKRDNPELVAARGRAIPVVRRAEMLAELMRFKSAIAIGGTHGKTTTTSLVAALLDAGDLDPTVINGGIINAYGTNARLGGGDWMVVEADESDGTFVKLPADVAVVTNIDPEHLDHYGSFEAVRDAFAAFVENVPFYGFAVMCLDDADVQALVGSVTDRRVITYGTTPQADVRYRDISFNAGRSRFSIDREDRLSGESETIADLDLPMPGEHNIANATAAIAVARALGISAEAIRAGLSRFAGVKRRFTHCGQWNGADIYDDYGHHPVEISAVLKAARAAVQTDDGGEGGEETGGRVIAVVQPHRYSRLHDLFADFCTCFNDADIVLVTDVYEAGETPIEGADRDGLVEGLRASGHRDARPLEGPEVLAQVIAEIAAPGDMVLCLGAGSITHWANALPDELAALEAANPAQ